MLQRLSMTVSCSTLVLGTLEEINVDGRIWRNRSGNGVLGQGQNKWSAVHVVWARMPKGKAHALKKLYGVLFPRHLRCVERGSAGWLLRNSEASHV